MARLLGDEGLGPHGFVAARDLDDPPTVAIAPIGLPFRRVGRIDLVAAGAGVGRDVAGQAADPLAASLHRAIASTRSDVTAVVLGRGPNTVAWTTLGRVLDPVTEDGAYLFGDHTLLDPEVASDASEAPEEWARSVAHAIGPHKAVLLRGRGAVTVGRTVEEAAWWALTVEWASRVQLLAEAAGRPLHLDHGVIAALLASPDAVHELAHQRLARLLEPAPEVEDTPAFAVVTRSDRR